MKRILGLAIAALLALSSVGEAQVTAPPDAFRNSIICGDFGNCPWQDGVAGVTGVANTATYTGASNWFVVGGASSSIIAKQAAPTVALAGVQQTLQVQRTSTNANTANICAGYILETPEALKFAGKTAVFSVNDVMSATGLFTAANIQIIGGTGSSESLANLAAGTWTGQTTLLNLTGLVPSVNWMSRIAAVAVPTTVTELAVEFCETPSGTAGASDFFQLEFAQLEPQSLGVTSPTTFERASPAIEFLRDLRYEYVANEPANGVPFPGYCQATGATAGICVIPVPVPMRVAPTFSVVAISTWKVNVAGTPTAAGTLTPATGSVQACSATHAITNTAGQFELLQGGGGTGVLKCNARQ